MVKKISISTSIKLALVLYAASITNAYLADTAPGSEVSNTTIISNESGNNDDTLSVFKDDTLQSILQNDRSRERTIRNSTLQAALNRADKANNCDQIPVREIQDVTSNRWYFLSEILSADIPERSPECGAELVCFLDQIVAHQVDNTEPPSQHSNATLIVDRRCRIEQTLTIPDRFILSGVGSDGEGALLFDIPDSASAIVFSPDEGAAQRFSTIRDIRIANSQCCGQFGIDVSNSTFVTIENIRLSDFAFGIYGTTAFRINVIDSKIHSNGFNILLGENTTSWRIRDTTSSQSIFGVVIHPTSRGNLISGAVIESNIINGVKLDGDQNVIENSWFEGNGINFGDHGIHASAGADQNRILSNLFSSEDIRDEGSDTQICFNTDDNAFDDYNNCLKYNVR